MKPNFWARLNTRHPSAITEIAILMSLYVSTLWAADAGLISRRVEDQGLLALMALMGIRLVPSDGYGWILPDFTRKLRGLLLIICLSNIVWIFAIFLDLPHPPATLLIVIIGFLGFAVTILKKYSWDRRKQPTAEVQQTDRG